MAHRTATTLCCQAITVLAFMLQWTGTFSAYVYDRCGNNNSIADKVHRDIPNPNHLGNLTSCSLSANTYSSDYCIVAAVLTVVGAFFCFFGCRFFKVILFFIGVLLAGGLVFFLMFNHLPCETPHFGWVIIGVSAAVGLLAGTATVCLFVVGVFAIGAAAGALLMLSFLSVLNSKYIETHQWLPIVLVIALALVFGIIALKLKERFVAIPCTAFIGAVMTTYGLDYYVENAAAVQYTWLLMEGKSPHLKCVQTWVMLTAVWPLLLIAGLLVQCLKTGKKKDEDEEDGDGERRGYRRRGSKQERGHLMRDIG
ncbi:transmembrane protein 198-like [Sycon ciliatum]|uniref:transmembrane protein 198-like n=1 Tax=Sycon ciliatum TaxID=27933 RepID=UPI0031F63CE1|eukprot:scpid74326/ scgid3582/ 